MRRRAPDLLERLFFAAEGEIRVNETGALVVDPIGALL
jgi:hypothetical protein